MGVPSHRKALAGKLMAEGHTQRAALLAVGYSKSTASKPGESGLGADRCIPAAQAAGLIPDLSTLRNRVRRVLSKKLGRLEASDKQLDATRISEIARTLDVVERSAAGRDKDSPSKDARNFVDRMEWLAAVLAEAKARGLNNPTSDK